MCGTCPLCYIILVFERCFLSHTVQQHIEKYIRIQPREQHLPKCRPNLILLRNLILTIRIVVHYNLTK